jgi:glycerophosphoryl diester phosphodiesterase
MTQKKIPLGGHRGMGCTDHGFYYQRDIRNLPVENTVESVVKAFENGADYIETDAVMSEDGILFAIHNVVPKDHFFTPDMPPALLNKMKFADIQKFRTGHRHNGMIQPFGEMLDAIAKHDPKTLPWAMNIEVKGVQGSGQNYEANDYLDRLAKTIRESDLPPERILWSSFSLANVLAMSRHFPQSQFGMLFSEKPEPRAIYADHQDDPRYQYLPFNPAQIDFTARTWQVEADANAKLGYLHPEVATITLDTITSAKQYGLGINCWALFEHIDSGRSALYDALLKQTTENRVPFTIITDYLDEFKSA